MSRRSGAIRWRLLVALGYAAMVAVVVGLMIHARQSALATLATPQSISEWQAWREEAKQRQDRREPKSAEPPALVLMRDFFGVCLTGALVFTSLLYWLLAWFVAGILKTPRRVES